MKNFRKASEKNSALFRIVSIRNLRAIFRESWKEFETFSGAISPLGPDKPEHQPKIDPRKIEAPEEIPGQVVNPNQKFSENFNPLDLPVDKNSLDNPTLRSIDVSFFGITLPTRYDPAMYFEMEGMYAESIPNSWEKLAETDYYPLIYQFSLVAERMNLNDWGYYQLIRQFADRFYPGEYDQQVLFSCFMLNKSGYKAKIGFDHHQMFLLLPSVQDVFEIPYLTVSKERYYVFPINPSSNTDNLSITTYEGEYRKTDRAINFAFYDQLNLPKNIRQKTLSFSMGEEVFSFPVSYDQSLVDFYQNMPLVGFEVTLSAPLSEEAMKSLKAGLQPILRDKSEKEKADILLAFVQKAFDYKTDQEQFRPRKVSLSGGSSVFPQFRL